jgi:hypothetical protein
VRRDRYGLGSGAEGEDPEEAQSRAVCNYSLEGGVRVMRVCLP